MNELAVKKVKELSQTRSDFWNIPYETGILLNTIIKSSNYKNILEVGMSNGLSTIFWADAAKHTAGRVVAIEFWQKRIDLALQNFKDVQLDEFINIKHGSALKIIPDLVKEDFNSENLEIDFVFIDANKGEYLKYYNQIEPLVKKSGMIVADNVLSHKEKVQDFLDEIEGNPEYQCSYYDFDGGLLIALKV